MTPSLLISPFVAVLSRLMAIIRKQVEPEGGLPLVFNNGDLEALQKAVERLGFKDEVSLLRYALAVISQSATRTLTVIDQDGKSVALNPSGALLAAVNQSPVAAPPPQPKPTTVAPAPAPKATP